MVGRGDGMTRANLDEAVEWIAFIAVLLLIVIGMSVMGPESYR